MQGGVTLSRVPWWVIPEPCPHPFGARSLLPRPWRGLPGTCLSSQQKERFHVISCKVSQNREVSPKYDEKACHAPYLQNGSQKSPLDFLGFPIWLAFSPKELMGLFWPEVRV